MDELSKIATKYGIINNGNLIEESLAADLNSRCESRIELLTDNPTATVNVLEKLGFSQIKVTDEGKIIIFEQFDRTGDITLTLASEGITTFEIVKKLESIENYYLKHFCGIPEQSERQKKPADRRLRQPAAGE